jgi:chromosome segregation ATPase
VLLQSVLRVNNQMHTIDELAGQLEESEAERTAALNRVNELAGQLDSAQRIRDDAEEEAEDAISQLAEAEQRVSALIELLRCVAESLRPLADSADGIIEEIMSVVGKRKVMTVERMGEILRDEYKDLGADLYAEGHFCRCDTSCDEEDDDNY